MIKNALNLKKMSKIELRLFAAWVLIIALLLSETLVRKVSLSFNRLNEETVLATRKYDRFTGILESKDKINELYSGVFSGRINSPDQETLLSSIEELAAGMGIAILSVKPVKTEDHGFYFLYSLQIEAGNTVPEMMVFLNELNSQLKGIELESLEVRAKEQNRVPEISILLNTIGFKE